MEISKKNIFLVIVSIIILFQVMSLTVANAATDTTPPTASAIIAPVSTIYGTTFAVNAMSVADSSGVASVRFAVWSKSNQSDLLWYTGVNFNNGNWGIAANIANHNNNRGTYYIHVYATDGVGNYGFIGSTTVQVLLDTTAPTASSIAAPVSTTYGTTFQVNAMNVTDAGTGIAKVEFAVWSKSDQSDLIWYQGVNFNNGNWGITANIANHANNRGSYLIHVYATDNSGNRGFLGWTSVNVFLDTTAPTVSSIAAPSATVFGTTFEVHAMNVADTQSGVAAVKFAVWSKSDQSDLIWYQGVNFNNGNWGITANIANHNNNRGTYIIHVYAKDNSGNEAFVGFTTVANILDTTMPVIGIDSPVNNSFINGRVLITGTASDLYLDYWKIDYGVGTTPSVWTQIATGTGSLTNNTFSTWDTGLIADGIYTLRLRAKDKAGNTSQATRQITLDNAPPSIPTALVCSSKTDAKVNLAWGVSTDNVGVERYIVYRDGVEIGTATNMSFTDENVVLGMIYAYTVKAADALGNTSAASDPLSITITDTTPPLKPANVICTATTKTTATIIWKESIDNVGTTEYVMYRDGAEIASTSNTTYTDPNVVEGGIYKYTIQAKDAEGNISDPSDELSVSVPDITLPTAPTELTFTLIGNSVHLVWNASTDNLGVTEYEIYRNNNKVGSTSETFYTDDGLSIGTVFTYTIKAKDAAGNLSDASDEKSVSTENTQDVTPPTAPVFDYSNCTKTETSVSLTWTQSTDNTGVTGYEVYRDAIKIDETTGTVYTDTSGELIIGNTYVYVVKAKDAQGNLSDGAALSVTITDLTPPSIPANLKSDSKTESTITLSWDESTDNVDVTEYEIFRDGIKVGSTQETTFTDRELTIKNYVYSVKAKDFCSNLSDASALLSVGTVDTTAPTAPTDFVCSSKTDTSASFSWEASKDNDRILEYDIFRDEAQVGSTADTTYTDNGLTVGQTYKYYIIAKDPTGNISDASDSVNVVSDATPPTSPTNLVCTTNADNKVIIAWTASSDTVGVTRYDIYRDGNLIGTASSPSYTDIDIPARSYNYSIKAADNAGNISEASNALNITVTDVNPPTLGWVTPENNAICNDSVFTMSANGVSDPSGVSSILFSVYNAADGLGITYSGVNKGGGTWEAAFDASRHTTKTGTFYMTVRGTDTSGNTAILSSSQFTVSQKAIVTDPSQNLGNSFLTQGTNIATAAQTDVSSKAGVVTVKATSIENSSGIRSVKVKVYGMNKSGRLITTQAVLKELTNTDGITWECSFNISEIMGANKGSIRIDIIVYGTDGAQSDLGRYNITV